MKASRLLPLTSVAAVLVLSLSACGGNDDSSDSSHEPSKSHSTTSASASASASASPQSSDSASASSTASETSSSEAAPQPSPTETAPAAEADTAPAAEATQPAASDQSQLQQYFATGGGCISDVWNSSLPRTDALAAQVDAYCDANDLGDWADGANPRDMSQYGGGEAAEDPAATQAETPAAKTEDQIAAEKQRCETASIETAPSGTIQYCYMEYGISIR